MSSLSAVGLVSLLAGVARGQEPAPEPAAEATQSPWWFGFMAGVPTLSGTYGPLGLTLRREHHPHAELDLSLGFPATGQGMSLWADHVWNLRLLGQEQGPLVLSAHGGVGALVGFLGTGFYARNYDVFVGDRYTLGGPLALAARAPVGIGLRWKHRRELTAEVAPMLVFNARTAPKLEARLPICLRLSFRL